MAVVVRFAVDSIWPIGAWALAGAVVLLLRWSLAGTHRRGVGVCRVVGGRDTARSFGVAIGMWRGLNG